MPKMKFSCGATFSFFKNVCLVYSGHWHSLLICISIHMKRLSAVQGKEVGGLEISHLNSLRTNRVSKLTMPYTN